MRVQALWIVLLAAGTLSAGGQDANKKVLEQLQGDWQMEKAIQGGKPAPEEKVQGSIMTFKGEKITVKEAKRVNPEEVTFTIDASKKPSTIDITPPNDQAVKGIFQLEGDTLKLAFSRPGSERPTEFAAPEGSQIVFIQLRRAKK
jgi:uncharacterized protein (TIGR03067 family)